MSRNDRTLESQPLEERRSGISDSIEHFRSILEWLEDIEHYIKTKPLWSIPPAENYLGSPWLQNKEQEWSSKKPHASRSALAAIKKWSAEDTIYNSARGDAGPLENTDGREAQLRLDQGDGACSPQIRLPIRSAVCPNPPILPPFSPAYPLMVRPSAMAPCARPSVGRKSAIWPRGTPSSQPGSC